MSDTAYLLLPISATLPSGKNVRYDDIYNKIRIKRSKAIEEKDDSVWRNILELTEDVLVNTSKDLHIACWWVEAKTHISGINGLHIGLTLIKELSEKFWDTLFPLDQNDPDVRLSSYEWINEKLTDTVLYVSILTSSIKGEPPICLHNYIDAIELQKNLSKSGSRKKEILEHALNDGKHTTDSIKKSQTIADISFSLNVLTTTTACIKLLEGLELFLDEKHPKEGLSFRNLIKLLDHIRQFTAKTLELAQNHKEAKEQPIIEEHQEETPVLSLEESIQEQVKNLSIEECHIFLQHLEKRISFIDPKSTAPYLIRRAAEWGNMSIGALIEDLAAKDVDIKQLARILGI